MSAVVPHAPPENVEGGGVTVFGGGDLLRLFLRKFWKGEVFGGGSGLTSDPGSSNSSKLWSGSSRGAYFANRIFILFSNSV